MISSTQTSRRLDYQDFRIPWYALVQGFLATPGFVIKYATHQLQIQSMVGSYHATNPVAIRVPLPHSRV